MFHWKRNLIVSWITQIFSLIGFGFVMPFLPFYIQELGVSSPESLQAWVGYINAAPALVMGAMAPVWGFLADRLGRKLMILRAMIGGAVIMSLIAAAKTVQAVFILRTVQGLFTGTITASATLVASGTPKDRLSFALGFLSSSTFIGFAFGPFVGGLLAEFIGYRATFFAGAGIIAAAFFLVLLFVKEPHVKAAEPEPGDEDFSWKQLLRQPFTMVFPSLFLMRFSRSLPQPFLPLYVQQIRGTLTGASAVTGFISAALGVVTAAAGLTLARLGDRFDKQRLIALFLSAGAVVSLPIFFTGSLWSFTLFYVLATFCLGGVEPILQSLVSFHTPAAKRGLLFGIQTAIASLGWFIAPIVGSRITIRFSIKHAFLAYSLSLFLALSAVVMLSTVLSGKRRRSFPR
jgi:DHA1 family multidrug resistance protein-like MFS transporter